MLPRDFFLNATLLLICNIFSTNGQQSPLNYSRATREITHNGNTANIFISKQRSYSDSDIIEHRNNACSNYCL